MQTKIRNQGRLLAALGREEGQALLLMAERVKSGDTANAEAGLHVDRQYENIIRFNGQSRRRQRKNPGQLALF